MIKSLNMENVTRTVKKVIIRKSVNTKEIFPYMETASAERGRPEQDNADHLSACRLFSLFTADIIKQNKPFVR